MRYWSHDNRKSGSFPPKFFFLTRDDQRTKEKISFWQSKVWIFPPSILTRWDMNSKKLLSLEQIAERHVTNFLFLVSDKRKFVYYSGSLQKKQTKKLWQSKVWIFPPSIFWHGIWTGTCYLMSKSPKDVSQICLNLTRVNIFQNSWERCRNCATCCCTCPARPGHSHFVGEVPSESQSESSKRARRDVRLLGHIKVCENLELEKFRSGKEKKRNFVHFISDLQKTRDFKTDIFEISIGNQSK